MRRDWDPEELIACWTLVEHDWELVGKKTGATRLGFALLLKFFELEARFPRHAGELPKAAVAYLAEQVKVEPPRTLTARWGEATGCPGAIGRYGGKSTDGHIWSCPREGLPAASLGAPSHSRYAVLAATLVGGAAALEM
jgi:hypothetical protein